MPSKVNGEVGEKGIVTSDSGLKKIGGGLQTRPPASSERKEDGVGGKGDRKGEELGSGGLPPKKTDTATSVAPALDLLESPLAKAQAAIPIVEPTTNGITTSNKPKDLAITRQAEGSTPNHENSADENVMSTTTKPIAGTVENSSTDYYSHAQQAFIVASLGGLAGALEAAPGEPGPPRETGRSLFLALDITTWEADADVVLEVGWAAVWWQEKIRAEPAERGGFEEMQDRGHYV